jgi:imidazole glycerol phosphate synthase glutamine amidotransferase subunit
MPAGAVKVAVIKTGTANLASVLAALNRIGAEGYLTEDPALVRKADKVVLPGVGSFGAAMERLNELGLTDVLRERILDLRPTMTICLGMQILCAGSEESPGVPGLDVIHDVPARFTGPSRVPQLGWNQVLPQPGCLLLTPGWAYFANSYRLIAPPVGWNAAMTDYDGLFTAAVERGPVLACQFHPELSGAWGADLIRRWLAC